MIPMQRYFIEPTQIQGNEILITDDDAKHIAKVMRNDVGDQVICASEGRSYLAEIRAVDAKSVSLSIINELTISNEPTIDITIYQGLTKADKMEWIIQKGTEIGVNTFVPVEMKYSVTKWESDRGSKKLDRWQKIAKEAAEQAQRSRIPTIKPAISFKEMITEISKKHSLTMLAYEKSEHSQGIFALLKQHQGIHDFAIIIGPEGGISEQERDLAMQQGVSLINLGRRILRTETAGLIAATGVLFYHQQLGES